MKQQSIGFALRPGQVIGPLAFVAIGLTSLHLISTYLVYLEGWSTAGAFHQMVDLNRERNLPSYYAGMLHLVLAATTLLVGMVERRQQSGFDRVWFSWAAVFAFFSVDEIISIHERISNPLQNLLGTSGWLSYAWVIPYVVLAITVAIGSIKVLVRLPSQIRNRLVLGGIVFVIGAAGMEVIGLALFGRRNHDNLGYALVATVEEILEMTGMLLFLSGVLGRLSWWLDQTPITVSAAAPLPATTVRSVHRAGSQLLARVSRPS